MRTTIVKSIFILIFVFASCDRSNDGKKTLDFGQFTIEVPATWSKVKLRGIDSFAGLIAIDETDTLNFDLGWYSNSLIESPPYRIYGTDEGSEVYLINENKSTPDSVVYEFAGMMIDVNLFKFMKDTAIYSTIDNREAKIVMPKKPGTGTTGVYFDSLWTAGSDNDRFQMNAKNLKPENEQLFLEAIKTIRFKNE